jgi:cell division protein FtsZ
LYLRHLHQCDIFVGGKAAEESLDDILKELGHCNMVFIAAGLGGGTGTGAAPVIARALKKLGILTVAVGALFVRQSSLLRANTKRVVTKPFVFERGTRHRLAEHGINELKGSVDTMLVVPNENLFRVASANTSLLEAFQHADAVLHQGVRTITDLIVQPGLINLDFADVRTVMSEKGFALMGTGEAEGERRAGIAAEAAINNPLLDHSSLKGAKGIIINIAGGQDLTLHEVDDAAQYIKNQAPQDANIIFGAQVRTIFLLCPACKV